MALINPLSVQGFLLICEEKGFTAVAQSASASQVGKNFIYGAKKAGITLVNFVRRAEQAELLKGLGAEIVIDKSQEGWEEEATKILAENKVQAYFDPLGGPDGGKIISLLPSNTWIYLYGCLTSKPLEVNVGDVVLRGKQILGFYMNKELSDPERAKKIFANTFENLSSGVFKSEIAKRFPHEKFEEALEYYKNWAAKGKVLLQNPNFDN